MDSVRVCLMMTGSGYRGLSSAARGEVFFPGQMRGRWAPKSPGTSVDRRTQQSEHVAYAVRFKSPCWWV